MIRTSIHNEYDLINEQLPSANPTWSAFTPGPRTLRPSSTPRSCNKLPPMTHTVLDLIWMGETYMLKAHTQVKLYESFITACYRSGSSLSNRSPSDSKVVHLTLPEYVFFFRSMWMILVQFRHYLGYRLP